MRPTVFVAALFLLITHGLSYMALSDENLTLLPGYTRLALAKDLLIELDGDKVVRKIPFPKEDGSIEGFDNLSKETQKQLADYLEGNLEKFQVSMSGRLSDPRLSKVRGERRIMGIKSFLNERGFGDMRGNFLKVNAGNTGVPSLPGKTDAETGLTALSIVLSSLNSQSSSVMAISPNSLKNGQATLDLATLSYYLPRETFRAMLQADPGTKCNRPARVNALIAKLTSPSIYYPSVSRSTETLNELKNAFGIKGDGQHIDIPKDELNRSSTKARLHAFSTPAGTVFRVQYSLDTGNPARALPEGSFSPDAERWIFPLKNGLRGEMWFNAMGKRQDVGPATVVGDGLRARGIPPMSAYFPWTPYLDRSLASELAGKDAEKNKIVRRDADATMAAFTKIIPELKDTKNSAAYDVLVSQIKNKFDEPLTSEEAAKELGVPLEGTRTLIKDKIARAEFEQQFCALRETALQESGPLTPHRQQQPDGKKPAEQQKDRDIHS